MERLKSDLKTQEFQKVYLFYGEEEYLKKYYVEEIIKKIIPKGQEMMNMSIVEGNQIVPEQIIEAAETLPFLSEKRLIVVKDSELFKSGRADDTQKIVDFLPDIPSTCCLLFVETNIDRRNKGYKAIQKWGRTVEFTHLKEKDLVSWVKKMFKKQGRDMDTQTAIYLFRTVGFEMERLEGEIEKIISYTEEQRIQKKDIDDICIPSLEIRIFELVKALGNKQSQKALEIYSNLILMKESPHMILAMIIRQFRLILQVKYLQEQGMSRRQMAQRLGIQDFIIRDCLQQSQGFSLSTLKNALQESLETDVNIKSGKIEAVLGVEMLLIKYLH